MQKMYDKGWFKKHLPKKLLQLWEVVLKVRKEREDAGVSQDALRLKRNALAVTGVIYAIWSTRTSRVYVGQTCSSSFHRFQQHCWRARRKPELPIHRAMARFGWRNFFIFPLEKIDVSSVKGGKLAREEFARRATPREEFWINRLHTFCPLGFNVRSSGRQRHRPHRRNNPMKWCRKFHAQVEEKDVNQNEEQEADQRWYASRDFLRRCAYLISRQDNNTLASIESRRYKKRNLWRMLKVMESKEHTFEEESAKAVTKWLRAALLLRCSKQKDKARSPSLVIKLEWNSRLLRLVPLRSVVLKYKDYLPNEYSDLMTDVLVVRKLTKPLGRSVLNYSTTARDLVVKDCRCSELFESKFHSPQGCVLTGDSGIVRHRELRGLLKKGPRFRTHLEADPMSALKEALDACIESLMKDGTPKCDFLPWRTQVLHECERRLSTRSAWSSKKIVVSSAARKYLRFLQHHLVLVPVDKAANNIAFVCKKLYCQLLTNELSNPQGAYVSVQKKVELILAEHKQYLESKKFEVKDQLAYLYWLPKLHKNPVGQRFIAGSAVCSTTDLSKVLSDVLNLVLKTLLEKDDECALETGVRRFFVVTTYEEVASSLSQQMPISHNCQLRTGDFSTMYTTIPHDDLLARIQQVTQEAWEWAARREAVPLCDVVVRWTSSETQWARKARGRFLDAKFCHTLTHSHLNDLVSFLVKNIYLVNGGECKRQSLGIPMGTNCAPALANLYMYSYESEFIDRQNSDVATAFRHTYRLIDDVLSVGNPFWEKAVGVSAEAGGMYPSCLQLNDTSISPSSVNFLGMQILLRRGRIVLDVFDKRKEFKFLVNRYPHMDSLIPESIPYGVFSGLVHRFYRICSEKEAFVRQCRELASVLVAQGCAVKRIRNEFRRALRKLWPVKWNTSVWKLFRAFSL
jgi:hypothetical protein